MDMCYHLSNLESLCDYLSKLWGVDDLFLILLEKCYMDGNISNMQFV